MQPVLLKKQLYGRIKKVEWRLLHHNNHIEIITGGCVWYERGMDGKEVVCNLCKREPDSVEQFSYSCTMFKNDVNDMFNYVCKEILIANFAYMTVEYKLQVILTDNG